MYHDRHSSPLAAASSIKNAPPGAVIWIINCCEGSRREAVGYKWQFSVGDGDHQPAKTQTLDRT